MGFLGLDFKSREEREQEERDYLYRIFPGGGDEKAAVEKELASRLPGLDGKELMLFYILVRDAMTVRGGCSFEDAAARVAGKQRILKVTPEIVEAVKAVMDGKQHT